ncbi:MAG: hypothetical protein R2795_22815 [Saprospiraceae bacterium]
MKQVLLSRIRAAGRSYAINENSTTQICAAAGETVTVTFTAFDAEASSSTSCYDNLTVSGAVAGNATYSGDDSDGGAGLSCTDATDTNGDPTLGPFTSAVGGCLTFEFSSDGSVTRSGWIADVTTSAACPVPTVDITICGDFSCETGYEAAAYGY